MTRDEFLGDFCLSCGTVQPRKGAAEALDSLIAAAREEQREVCAQACAQYPAPCRDQGEVSASEYAFECRSLLLTATPLADEIAALRETCRMDEGLINTQADRIRELETGLKDKGEGFYGRFAARLLTSRDAALARVQELEAKLSALSDKPAPNVGSNGQACSACSGTGYPKRALREWSHERCALCKGTGRAP